LQTNYYNQSTIQIQANWDYDESRGLLGYSPFSRQVIHKIVGKFNIKMKRKQCNSLPVIIYRLIFYKVCATLGMSGLLIKCSLCEEIVLIYRTVKVQQILLIKCVFNLTL